MLRTLGVMCLASAVLAAGGLVAAPSARGAERQPNGAQAGHPLAEAARLKAVFIVGPAGAMTAPDLADAEALALIAESYGMDVRRVYHPNATWDAVMANIQGANLVYYAGHGYGWPSPYTVKLTESRQNGVGLNSFPGSSARQHVYYGADVIRANWVLAPNAIVFLNHDCYTAGNGEPGAPIPTWDVARQRVDNFAAGFLDVGARAVFAYSYQRFNKTLQGLFTPDQTMEQIFMIPGFKATAYYGWIGDDPRKFDSERTPGARNFLDPDPKDGFLRALTGDLGMTAAEWANGAPPDEGDDDEPPQLTGFAAQPPATAPFLSSELPVFSPNGDGVADDLTLKFSVDREAFVDLAVRDEQGDVVRTMSAWSAGGSGSTPWDGKNDAGSYVADGAYEIKATPRNRTGTTGDPEKVDVSVLTTMSHPSAAPGVLHAADGDDLGAAAELSVRLDETATFWWKIANAEGHVVRTYANGVATAAGTLRWDWDGRDNAGAFVPDGTYYSVTTTATVAGMNTHAVPVEVGAFRLTPRSTAPFVRGTKVTVFVESAEPIVGKPKVRVTVEGMTPKSFASKAAPGGWVATIKFAATGNVGNVIFSVYGTDTGGQYQETSYPFELRSSQ